MTLPFKNERESLAWSMYYSAIIGWQYHPGNKDKLTTYDAAIVADKMLVEYKKRHDFLLREE